MSATTANPPSQTALMLVNPFPPNGRVGGSIRTVKFIKYLSTAGWRCVVLSPGPGGGVYPGPQSAEALLNELPATCELIYQNAFLRVPAWLLGRRTTGDWFDAAAGQGPARSGVRHRLLQASKNLLLPDEEILWVFSAAHLGLRLIQDKKIDVIYTVVPQFSTALLGSWLSRKSGLPLVLDIKDDWMEHSGRNSRPSWAIHLELVMESAVARQAARLVFTSPEALKSFRQRHPGVPDRHLVQIPNGFDLAEFREVKATIEVEMPETFLIVSGAGGLNRRYRDIQPFLTAVAHWCASSPHVVNDLRILFLGSDVYQDYGAFIHDQGLAEVIQCQPVLPRQQYLRFLLSAHLLLLVQMDDAPSSISGTLYEYGAAGNTPVLLVGGKGATSSFVLEQGLGTAIPAEQTGEIENCLRTHYEAWKQGTPRKIRRAPSLEQFDRQHQARQLAALFDCCLDSAQGRVDHY
jgi:hypothetical protein